MKTNEMIIERVHESEQSYRLAMEQVHAWLGEHAGGYGVSDDMQALGWKVNRAGETVGILTGRLMWDWIFVKMLAVAPNYQRQGIGRMLMEKAETYAKEYQLTGIHLDTFTYQAPAFYEKLGYVEFGRLTDLPPGHTRIYYAKRLKTKGN